MRGRTKYLTVSAMLAALGVILLGLGSLINTLDLTVAALASILCVWAVIEMGKTYAWMIWLVTSFLAILLLPQKSPGCFYLFPILKERLERLPRAVEWVLKIVIFHAMIALCWLVLRIFVPGEAALEFGWLLLATYALVLVAFLLYDYALTKLISFYLQKLQKRIGLKRKK